MVWFTVCGEPANRTFPGRQRQRAGIVREVVETKGS
jgi:hypothetical protein